MPKAQTSAKPSTQPNTVTGLAGWVEVFKAGNHVDSKGRQISFSRADLDQMIANHDLGAAPAVLGHPAKIQTKEEKSGAPAYAWAGGYKRDGDTLFAKFTDINTAFEAGVQSGAYRNRSVSVFPDKTHGWRIRHIGWLGAEPPAIDGLKAVEFSGDDAESHEFSAPGYSLVWGMESLAKLLRGLREQAIAKDGLEAADLVLPQWQIDSAMESAARARTEFQEADGNSGRLFSQHDNSGGSMSFTKEQLDAAIEDARKAGKTEASASFAASEAELIKLKAERQAERIKAQIKGWVGEGKVLPAEEPGLAEFMASIESVDAEFSFSASDGKEAKKTAPAFFADFMASRKALVKLGTRSAGPESDVETGADDVADFSQQRGYSGVEVNAERMAVDSRIKTYMAKHKVDYATAAARVMAG